MSAEEETRMSRVTAFALLAFLLNLGPVLAAPAPPQIAVKEVTEAPKLDGLLNDACWQGLPQYTDFFDERSKEPARMKTSVMLCRDKEFIYVAYHAFYPDPKKIPAHEKKRNGRTSADDSVWINIDSSHQHRDWSCFAVNSIGTQFDWIEGGSISKIQWRGDWRAAAKVVDDGYNVEMAIPFALLKHKKGQDTFGLCFERWLPKEKSWVSWPNLNGEWDGHAFADWTEVHAPYIAPRPSALSYVIAETGSGDHHARGGVDVKYPFAPNRLGQLSIKPDFGTIEQDVESVDFSYTERLLSDYRPFFREWDLGAPPPMFYSRRIEDFDIGGKVVSRGGAHNFELLNTRSGGSESDSVVRYQHPIGSRSDMSYGLADHSIPGHTNVVQYLDEWYGWKKGDRNHRIGGGNYFSQTTGLPNGWNNDFQYSTWGKNGSLGGNIRWARVESDFNGELGLTPEKDQQGWGWGPSWYKTYQNRKLRGMGFDLNTVSWNHLDGSHMRKEYGFGGSANYMAGYGYWARYWKSNRNNTDDAKEFFPSYFDNDIGLGGNWNSNVPDTDGGISIQFGERAGGKHTLYLVSQRFKLRDGLVLSVSNEWSKIADPSPYAGIGRQFIGTLNYDLTSEKSIGARLVQGRSLPGDPIHRPGRIVLPSDTPGHRRNLYFIYRQQVRRGMDMYVIYGDPNAAESIGRITVKLVEPIF
jgi:hypothetical protein